MQRHGPARTLREMLAQEGQVMALAGCTGPVLDAEDIAYTREVLVPYLDADDMRTCIECLFGDAAGRTLGFTPRGLSPWAGLALALHDARRERDAVAGPVLLAAPGPCDADGDLRRRGHRSLCSPPPRSPGGLAVTIGYDPAMWLTLLHGGTAALFLAMTAATLFTRGGRGDCRRWRRSTRRPGSGTETRGSSSARSSWRRGRGGARRGDGPPPAGAARRAGRGHYRR